MAADNREQAGEPWSPASSEIAEMSSPELRERRPNRWKGPKSTWRGWTERDRNTWTALQNIQKKDLSVHLYNAFALKKRKRDGLNLDIALPEGEVEGDWKPAKLWTAWPMSVTEVPGDCALETEWDEGEGETFRRKEEWGTDRLAGEVGAGMLKWAKERFRSREMDEEGADDSRRRGRRRERKKPMVTVNDDLSYKLLEPATKRIMGKMDDTLMILHNGRLGTLARRAPEVPEEDKTPRNRGRPRQSMPSPKRVPSSSRAKKERFPREGETWREMEVRIAREEKRRMPDHYAGKAQTEEEISERKRRERSRSKTISKAALSKPNLRRLGLRDWRDVLGAAAMAGFPPEAIARATQRCATLFDQQMTFHTLHERPIAAGEAAVETTTYVPEGIPLEYMMNDGPSLEEVVKRKRAATRQSNLRSRNASPDGAIVGFSRKFNLERHIQTMHGGTILGLAPDEEQDSADETVGAIHVDGFGKPIKKRRGWRGADRVKRTRPKGLKYRSRSRTPRSRARARRTRASRRQDSESEEEDDDDEAQYHSDSS
ncbi:hypothetical protein OQA88_3540 [Cercophora sp. LCS_1]